MKSHLVPSWQIQRKAFRGQALMELLGVIPLMLSILSLVAVAGWWTYGRMNAISHSYFMTMEISTYNSLQRLSSTDASLQSVTSGKPFWFDVEAYGSKNTFNIVFGLPAGMRVNFTFFVHGAVLSVDPAKVSPQNGGLQMFWDAPIREKYGDPKSTLPGSFCWYCSSQPPPVP
jgi:hypothetical protein